MPPRRTKRAPPLPAIMRYELEDSYDWGDFPPRYAAHSKLIFVMRNGAFKPQGSPCPKSGFFRHTQKKAAKHSIAPPCP